MQGHNSVVAEQLLSFIERVERLTEENVALQADILEVFSEAKGVGFDVKALKAIIKERAQDATAERDRLREVNAELLAALEVARAFIDAQHWYIDGPKLLARIDAALAKAREVR